MSRIGEPGRESSALEGVIPRGRSGLSHIWVVVRPEEENVSLFVLALACFASASRSHRGRYSTRSPSIGGDCTLHGRSLPPSIEKEGDLGRARFSPRVVS